MEQKKPPHTPASYRRQRQIEDCLYENLLRNPYQAVTVSDLCRQVGISRKAFYNYFPSKDACFAAIIDRTIRDSVLHLAGLASDGANPLRTYTAYLEYWKTQKPLLDIIVRNDLTYSFLLQNLRHVTDEDKTVLDLLKTPQVKSDMDILCCCMSAQLTLLLQWYSRGFDTPAEEMARKYLRLLYQPMFQMPEEKK